jgi:hypothetical protein
MKKLPITLFSFLPFSSLTLGVLIFLSFTQKSNAELKPYIVQSLEEKIGMNIEVKSLRMALDKIELTLCLDNNITLNAVSDEGIDSLENLFTNKKWINFSGNTTSLGGDITYRLDEDVIYTVLTDVPLVNILRVLGYKQSFLGQTFGKGWYDLKQKSGLMDLEIQSFQIKPTPLTDTITMLLGTDPSRIIFSSTKLHAVIKQKIITYTLEAIGTRSSITIREGTFNTLTDQHNANFTLVYEKYTLHGKIQGSKDNPQVTLDTQELLHNQLTDEKLQKTFDKAQKFLKGLSF